MSQHRIVRLFPDYSRDWPLWESPRTAPNGSCCTEPATYGLSAGLTERLAAWHAEWESHFDHARGWEDSAVGDRWGAQGERLAVDLARELDGVADVSYEPWPVGAAHVYLSGPDLIVRPCEAADVEALTAAEPPGADIAVRLFARAQRGESVYLLALVRGAVIGSGELLLGEAPELRHLQVAAASRGHGAGTAIVRAVERQLRTGQLSIGVGTDNPRARRLYERLGYLATGELTTTTYTYVDVDGTHEVTETGERLVKSLEI